MLYVQGFTFNDIQENTYVLFDEEGEAAIVDPGCYDKEEEEALTEFIQSKSLKVKMVLNTHGHIDHVLGNYFATQKFNVPLVIGEHDEATLRSSKIAAGIYGFERYTEVLPQQYLKEGDKVRIGSEELITLFTPGHAPGHIAFYHAPSKALLGGDVLFYRSIGRADLPGGNADVLINTIHQKFFTLPDDVTVYSGHGPTTTIGEEKLLNPFCGLGPH